MDVEIMEKYFFIEVHVFGYWYLEKIKAENIGLAANKAGADVMQRTGATIQRIVLDWKYPQGQDS